MNKEGSISKEVLEQFVKEASQRLVDIETGLLNIEKGECVDEQVRLIFRGFHGLKGIAGCVGARDIIEMANAGETLLAYVRDNGIEFQKSWVDIILGCHDDLKCLLEATRASGPMSSPLTQSVMKLNSVTQQLCNVSKSQRPEAPCDFKALVSGHVSGLRIYLDKWKPGKVNKELAQAIIRKLRIIGRMAKDSNKGAIENRISSGIAELNKRKEQKWRQTDIIEYSKIADDILEIADDDHNRVHKNGAIPHSGDKVRPKTARRLEVKPEYVDALEALVFDFALYSHRLTEDLGRVGELLRPRARPWLIGLESDLKQFSIALRQSCRRLRLTPISRILDRFPRMARDIAKREKKLVNLRITGSETELGMDQVERIAEPLAHLIRNAIDHGIESPEDRILMGKPEEANVAINVYCEGKNVVIRVSDDGRGIDFDKIKNKAVEFGYDEGKVESMDQGDLLTLIFLNGLTTQENANTISGRGVGMDIVRQSVSELNGSIQVNSSPGQGSEFIMKIPGNMDNDPNRGPIENDNALNNR